MHAGYDLLARPEVIGDAGGDGWGDLQRLVDTDEVVVDEVDRERIEDPLMSIWRILMWAAMGRRFISGRKTMLREIWEVHTWSAQSEILRRCLGFPASCVPGLGL